MKIRTGDTVQIQRGKDRGKSGKVIEAFPDAGRVVVEGLNMYKKHKRPKKQGEKGEIIQITKSLPVANVAFVCSQCKRNTRLGHRFEGEKKMRVCKKCNMTL